MRAVVALLLVGCGSSPAPSPITPPVVTPDAADVATPIDAVVATTNDAAGTARPIDAPPPPTATLENIVVAGELDAAKVTELLAPLARELAACLATSGPTTTELSLTIVKSAIAIRNAWQNDVATVPSCLRAIFKGHPDRAWNVGQTTVYVVVKAGTSPPEPPKLGERRAETSRLFCELEKLAGAEKLDVPDKQNKMIAWARDHIKHPVPLQIAADVPTWNPAERSYKLERAIKAEGIKKCPMQRW